VFLHDSRCGADVKRVLLCCYRCACGGVTVFFVRVAPTRILGLTLSLLPILPARAVSGGTTFLFMSRVIHIKQLMKSFTLPSVSVVLDQLPLASVDFNYIIPSIVECTRSFTEVRTHQIEIQNRTSWINISTIYSANVSKCTSRTLLCWSLTATTVVSRIDTCTYTSLLKIKCIDIIEWNFRA
jgi:hypothetical protein